MASPPAAPRRPARVRHVRRARRAPHLRVRRHVPHQLVAAASSAQGCQGVLTADATDLEQGCCSYGAHFVDEDDANATLGLRRPADRRAVAAPAASPCGEGARSVATATARSSPAWSATPASSSTDPASPAAPAARCTVPRSTPASGPLDWKPAVCWQLPLRLVETTDESGQVTSTLREWKRRDWGAGGYEFHWWCTEAPDAFVGHRPVYVELRDEIVEMVGEWAYDRFVEHVERVGHARARGSRELPAPSSAAAQLIQVSRARRETTGSSASRRRRSRPCTTRHGRHRARRRTRRRARFPPERRCQRCRGRCCA